MSNGFSFSPSQFPSGFGPGSQPAEGAEFTSMILPAAMRSYVPHVPDVSDSKQAAPALKLLAAIADACRLVAAGGACRIFDLSQLACDSRALLAETLGQGEASMTLGDEPVLTAQESVFAGVWILAGAGVDRIEVATIPRDALARAHRVIAAASMFDMPRPAGVVNAPALLTEIADRSAAWRPGQPPYAINLSLLPHTPEDLAWLEAALGQGAAAILSRGYGNCRITACALPRVWRVRFFNSMDALILDSFEVTAIPEIALAAPEDLAESGERIQEVLGAIG